MTSRAFPFIALWFYGFVALWLYGLARPRSSLALVPGPRSDFFGIFKTVLPTDPAPWLVRTKNLVGLYIITRAIYHKSLGDFPSMLMEIWLNCPKVVAHPTPPSPLAGLNFSGFSGFFGH